MQPRVSNLSGVEIYSLQSSRNPTPRGSSFNHADFFNIVGASAKGGEGAAAAGDEEKGAGGHSPQPQAVAVAAKWKDLHMLVWSSSASPVSERAAVHVFGAGADDHADVLAKGNFFFQSPLALGVAVLVGRAQAHTPVSVWLHS